MKEFKKVENINSLSIEELVYIKVKGLLKKDSVKKCGDLYDLTQESFERGIIKAVLEESGGNIKKASKILGISRNTISKRIKNLKIK